MPFNATLTAGQITQVRETTQYFEHYMLVTPNDIVFQAQVDSTKANVVYGDFSWIHTLQGDHANVVVGQTVLITDSTTDFTAPIVRGRTRKSPTSDVFYINENGINIDTTMYVTVIDTFDLVERIPRLVNGVQYRDYDEAFEDLPPTINGLQSAYADFSEAANVSWSFAPTATAQASGASISSWLWDVGDGTITVGTSASQNITVQFPGYATNEHRWVHLTVTDDNGTAQAFHFQVWTVAKNSSAVVALNTGQLSIDANVQDGWNGTFSTWASFGKSDILDLTRVVIAGIDHYDTDTDPITSNIMLIGQIRTESNTPSASETNVITETRITIEGFASQLARIPFVPQQILDIDSPDAYGEIADPNPARIITYILAYNTTALSLCSIEFEDLSAYSTGSTNLSDTNAIQNVLDIADVVKALPVYAPAGEIAVYRNANYISSSDRNALDTIFNFTEADYVNGFTLDIQYGTVIGRAVAGGIVYDTTNNEIDQLWLASAPPESFGGGYEETRMGNQVLTADSTQANAQTELSQRGGNDLAFVNPKPKLSVGVKDGFWFCIPTMYQWWTHTITSSTTVRGRTYTTSNRWWLQGISYTADNERNTRETTLNFEAETESTRAGIVPTLVPEVNEPTFDFPPLGGFDFFVDDPLVNYGVDAPSTKLPLESDFNLEPYPPALDNTPEIEQEILNVYMGASKNVTTTRDSVFGDTYEVEVSGDGTIGVEAGDTTNINFSNPAEYTLFDGTSLYGINTSTLDNSTVPAGSSSGSPAIKAGAIYDTGTGGSSRYIKGVFARFDFPSAVTITSVAGLFYRSNGTIPSGNAFGVYCYLYNADGVQIGLLQETLALTNVTWANRTLNSDDLASGVMSGVAYIVFQGQNSSGATFTNNYWLDDVSIVTATGAAIKGDAFYYSYNTGLATAYSAGAGLLVDGSNPSAPPYSDGHNYKFKITGTGNQFVFTYADSDYSDNDPNNLKVIVSGSNMGVSA